MYVFYRPGADSYARNINDRSCNSLRAHILGSMLITLFVDLTRLWSGNELASRVFQGHVGVRFNRVTSKLEF